MLDYILFDEKGNFKFRYSILWTFYPITYVVFVYTYSSLGGTFYNIGGSKKYAYPFLDFENYGVSTVLIWTFLIGLAIVLLGVILVFVDRKLKLIKKRD